MSVGSGRRVTDRTALGRLILEDDLRLDRVAFETGIHYRTLQEYVSGRKSPRGGHLAKLTEFFGVDPEDLVG